MANSAPALLFDEKSDDSINHVVLHPLALFHVLDHHTRRQERTGRVIGTLLGRRDGSRVEITNCFSVPHAERGEEVAIGKDFNKAMLALHMRSNKKESVVGWYATAATGEDAPSLIADTSSLIHDFYSGEVEDGNPVHIMVDTRLENDCLPIKAFRASAITIQGETIGSLFHEVPLVLESNAPEAICLSEMMKFYKNESSGGDSGKDLWGEGGGCLLASICKLYELLETTLQYVDGVVGGKNHPDSVVGRKIADALATVPCMRRDVFDRVQDSLHDMLMVTYLSNITRTQLVIAEKLNANLGNQLQA